MKGCCECGHETLGSCAKDFVSYSGEKVEREVYYIFHKAHKIYRSINTVDCSTQVSIRAQRRSIC